MSGAAPRRSRLSGDFPWETWRQAAAERSERHFDPYAVWALLTSFRQFDRIGDRSEAVTIDFLVELTESAAAFMAGWSGQIKNNHAEIPEIYQSPLPGTSKSARHVSLRMPLKWDSIASVSAAILELMLLDGVRRAQIGFPRPALPGEQAALDSMPSVVRQGRTSKAASQNGVLLGILEDACPFGHPALREPGGGTRVLALWDQSAAADSGGDSKATPADFGYGRQRTGPMLNGLIREHSGPAGLDEEALYADVRSLQPRLRDHASHAAAVVTLMAGRRSLLPSHSTSETAGHAEGDGRLPMPDGDSAGEAPIVVVQFPREQVGLAGSRWMVVRALDGLRYLAKFSQTLAGDGKPARPMVINLSYGSVVGAHDGTGLLETAMAELADAHPALAIVLAAGNSYGHARSESGDGLSRKPSGRHAVSHPLDVDQFTRLKLYVPPNKAIETYLELWFEPIESVDGALFMEPNELAIEVTPPWGQPFAVNQMPGIGVVGRVPDQTVAALLAFRRVSQSLKRSMALLVVAATQVSTSRVEAPSGTWSIKVTNRGQRQFTVHAWVERDLLPGSSRTAQAARLLDLEDDPHAACLSDDDTLNNVSTGEGVFRVGALTAQGCTPCPQVSPYSSAAAAGRRGPEFSAVADESPARPGVRVSGNVSAAITRMNGTSVAAPQAARWIANRLSEGRSLADVRAQIDASADGDSRRGRIAV